MPAHGPKPLGLRRSKRRWAFSLARFGAAVLILLVLVHILFQYLIAGESPPWFHGISGIQTLLGAGTEGAGLIGWLFVLAAIGCAVALWTSASRLAALLFFCAALWDAWWRMWELELRAADGLGYSFLPYFGAMTAFAALFAAFLALVGALSADRSSTSRIDGSLID